MNRRSVPCLVAAMALVACAPKPDPGISPEQAKTGLFAPPVAITPLPDEPAPVAVASGPATDGANPDAATTATLASSGATDPSLPRVERVRLAVERGIDGLMRTPPKQLDAVWVADLLIGYRRDARIESYVRRWSQEFVNRRDPFACVFAREASRPVLPEDLGSGAKRFLLSLVAPAAIPQERAIELLREFVAAEETTGFVLTHQFLMTELCRYTALPLPEETLARRPDLLKRIAAEQATDDRFSDLFAERAAILLHYGAEAWPPDSDGGPSDEEAARWIDLVLAAQGVAGAWEDGRPHPARYDGQDFNLTQTPAHTTVLALWTLLAWQAREAGTGPATPLPLPTIPPALPTIPPALPTPPVAP